MIRYDDDFTKPEVVLIGVAMTGSCLFKNVGSCAWNTLCISLHHLCIQLPSTSVCLGSDFGLAQSISVKVTGLSGTPGQQGDFKRMMAAFTST